MPTRKELHKSSFCTTKTTCSCKVHFLTEYYLPPSQQTACFDKCTLPYYWWSQFTNQKITINFVIQQAKHVCTSAPASPSSWEWGWGWGYVCTFPGGSYMYTATIGIAKNALCKLVIGILYKKLNLHVYVFPQSSAKKMLDYLSKIQAILNSATSRFWAVVLYNNFATQLITIKVSLYRRIWSISTCAYNSKSMER